VALSFKFTGSPTHPPLGALNPSIPSPSLDGYLRSGVARLDSSCCGTNHPFFRCDRIFYILPTSSAFLSWFKLNVLSSIENRSQIIGPDSNSSTTTHVHRSRLCVTVFFKLVMNHLQKSLHGSAPVVQRCYLPRVGKSNPCGIALAQTFTWNPRIRACFFCIDNELSCALPHKYYYLCLYQHWFQPLAM
jgi:hypothetical protein